MIKKALIWLKLIPEYQFTYFVNVIASILGIILVLINPSVYIGLVIFSLCINTYNFYKRYKESMKED